MPNIIGTKDGSIAVRQSASVPEKVLMDIVGPRGGLRGDIFMTPQETLTLAAAMTAVARQMEADFLLETALQRYKGKVTHD
jgi:hypothetical protein